MATISWTTGAAGAWSSASNWSPAQVPGSGDDALIAGSGSYQVTVAGATVHSVTLDDPGATLLSAGMVTIEDRLNLNAGTLVVATGMLIAAGSLANAGTILNLSSLFLLGPYANSSLSRIDGTGTLQLGNTLINTGGTFDGRVFGGQTIQALGTIVGGTVVGFTQSGAATLDGVTWRGRLNLANSPVWVRNGLHVTGSDGSGPGTIDLMGGSLDFQGDQSLDQVNLIGSGTVIVEDAVTFGAAFHAPVAAFGTLSLRPSMPNHGTINNSGTFEVAGQPVFPGDYGTRINVDVGGFENSGTVETTGAGGLSGDAMISFGTGTVINHQAGLLGAFGGRLVFDPASVLTNDGTITADAGSIAIGGLLLGTGHVTVDHGGSITFSGPVAATQSIDLLGASTLTLRQPSLFAGTISGFAPGDAINLGIAATPIGYSAGDLKLQTGGGTLDLHIAGPFSLANFTVSPAGIMQVDGNSATAPVVSGIGQGGTFFPGGPTIPLAGGLTIQDAGSSILVGATAAISGGTFAGAEDILSADTGSTGITAQYDSVTSILTLSGIASVADYQQVLRSVTFRSASADPTKGTSQPSRSIKWVVSDGAASSAPVTTTVSLRPPPRTLAWNGSGSDLASAGKWSDTTNALTPALLAPNATDTVQFITGGGDLTGAATAGAVSFGGGSVWHLGEGGLLNATGVVDVGAAAFSLLAVSDGGRLVGGAMNIAGAGDGIVAVEGAGSAIALAGPLVVGQSSSAELSILHGASVAAGSATIGLGASATGNVDIEGAGSHLDIAHDLTLGGSGVGVLTLGDGTELTVVDTLNIGANGVLNQFGGIIDPAVINNTGRAGGKGQISASVSIVNSGTLFAANGTETLVAPLITGTGVLEIDPSGDLTVNVGSVVATQTLTFTDGSGVLTIGTLSGFAATIGSYFPGDRIVVPSTTVAASSFDATTHVLTLFDAANNVAGTLQFGPGIANGATISVNGVLPCFLAGTRISTVRGDVAVEDLRVGDLVQVMTPPPNHAASPCGNGSVGGGASQPITWLGHRSVDCTRHPEPHKVRPVRVAAHALGRNRPHRDLYLSPDHALFIADVLIPVKWLINGSSIAQMRCDHVVYHHVELPQHAILLAENLPAESYLDTGDRANFANAFGQVTLHPDFSSRVREAAGCAPLVVAGPTLSAARHWVNALAA